MGVGDTAHFLSGRRRAIAGVLAFALVAGLAVAALAPGGSTASSHREAPYISTDPNADGTDLYAFVSPDDPRKVTLIANYIPLEEPAGGPNFNTFGDDVRYSFKIDNDGDAKTDIYYRFRFDTRRETGKTFLYNTGPVESPTDADLNIKQFYRVTKVRNGKKVKLGRNIPTPPVNVGPRSTPSYGDIAEQAVRKLPGGYKVFAGQRDDPFFVDLGSIFDLGGLRPFNPAHVIPLEAEDGVDAVSGFNVHTIALQVPIRQLTANKRMPDGPEDPNAIIGVWTTSERRTTRVFKKSGGVRNKGPWVQVSRLGIPLVNEVMIPLKDKNEWNASKPSTDKKFLKYVTDPELGRLIPVLYPGVETPPPPRDDLVTVALTGIPDVNQPKNVVPSEQLRLNMAIPPTPFNEQDRLGLLAGQLDGFPNGRRLVDDVTDILLRAIAGGYAFTPDFNVEPNNLLGDGVDENDVPFMHSFPYVANPHQGYSHDHMHRGQVMGP
jgi:hypothetical protein